MKKIFLFISFLVSLVANSQTQPPFQQIGNIGNEVKILGIGSAYKGFALRNDFADTTAMNLDLYLKNIRGVQARQGDTIWQRSNDLSRWFITGAGSIVLDSSSTFIPYGDGSIANPLGGNVSISQQQGNAIQSTGSGLFVKNFIQDGIKQPGAITWVSGYTYDVSPAIGVIGGIEYTSTWTSITLANSDPTFDRIDLVVFNAGVGSSVGTITVITGTPAADPQQPTVVDPSTQLAMAFILVTANTTQPPTPPAQDWIYINNAEWTTVSSTASINPASTILPYSVPLDVRGISVQNGDNIRFTSVSPPTISNFNVITFKIRSQAIWASDSKIGLRWYSGATPIGTEFSIANGVYGFVSTNLLSYQIITIPLSDFGALVNVTNLLMTVRTTGGRTISFLIDDIQLQNGILPSAGNPWVQGGNTFGQIGVFGTNDDNSISFKSNNIERMRLLKTGPMLIGATSTGVNYQLQVTGTTQSTVLRLPSLVMSESGSTTTFNTQGFNLTTTYGTNGAATHTLTNGGFSINKSQVGLGNTILAASNSTTGGRIATGNQAANTIYSATVGTVSGYYTGTLEYNSSGGVILASGNNYGVSLNFNNQLLANNTNAAWFQTYDNVTSTFPWILKKTGQQVWKPYGIGSFTSGTPAYGLAVTATGEVIEAPVGGGISAITADGGLSTTSSTNARLGGSALVANTSILTSTFSLTINSSNTTNSLNVVNTENSIGGHAIVGTGTLGDGVDGNSTSGNGVAGNSTSGVGVFARSSSTSNAGAYIMSSSSNVGTTNVIRVETLTSGVVADGLGGRIDYYIESDNGAGSGVARLSNQLISKWTTAANATRTSQFIITGVNSAVTGNILVIDGNGQVTLPGSPYVGLGAGYLAVSNTGVLSWSAGAGGSGDVLKVGTPVNNQLGVWTGNGTIEGDANLTFASSTLNIGVAGAATGIFTLSGVTSGTVTIQPASAAGTYTLTLPTDDGASNQVLTTNGSGVLSWSSPAGTGTVTDVTWTGGIVSIATSTTTPAFTIAGTSGGGVVFTSASTWASTGVLAANNIMIGGGAGVAYSTTTTGTGVLTALGVNVGSAGAFVTFNGALGTPSSGTATNLIGLPLTTGVTGTLPDDNGGTGQSTYATGDILYATGVNTLGKLAATTNGFVLTLSGSVPVWAAAGSGTVTSAAMSVPAFLSVSGSPITTSGTFAVTLSGTALPAANGGTGLTAYGTANQITGMNSGGTVLEYKTISASNGASVTHAANSIVVSTVFNPTVQTLTDGATITWNVTNGGNAVVTLAGTGRTLSITNPVAGYTYTIEITQGSGGSKTITTWPTGTTWSGGVAPTLSTTAGDVDVVVLYYNGTNYRGNFNDDFN